MNNDKRIILAIAVYAAVMTMILHTLTSEGHQRINSAKQQSWQYPEGQDESIPVCASGVVPIDDIEIKQETICNQDETDLMKGDDVTADSNVEAHS
jgi:hypothetical protein